MALKLFKYEDKPRDSNGFILTGKDRLYFFLNNPGWLKYYFSWRKTLIIKKNNPDATALDYGLPGLHMVPSSGFEVISGQICVYSNMGLVGQHCLLGGV